MSLKILILPIFIILELIIAIGYIKPNVDDILAKREEIAVAKEALTRVDTIVENVQSIGRLLKNRSEAVGFIERYYPMKLDEERVIDMFNYLAQQSGIIVTGIEIEQIPVANVSDTVYNEGLNSGLTPEEATLKAGAAAFSAPQRYMAKVATIGDYLNLKEFINRIHRSDRIHNTRKFSIAYRKRDPAKIEEDLAKGIRDTFLLGSFEAEFSYMGEQKSNDTLNNLLFQSPTFDFRIADEAAAFVKNPLPMLDAGVTGRANPYE